MSIAWFTRSELKNLRVVLDTNVLISCLAFHKETSRIWELVEEHRFDLFLSSFILIEMKRVLMRRKFNFPPEWVEALVDRAEAKAAQVVLPEKRVQAVKDDDSDNRILECALEAKADVIVTGDLKHIRSLNFFEGIEILTPREFMDKYFPRA